jgi:DNA polymerase-3 subunit beta
MASKMTVQKSIFAESLAIVGRAIASHTHLPVLGNILISKEEGQLRLSATDLTIGVSVWMDAKMDGDIGLTLPAKTLTDVVNSFTEPEVTFSVNGKPEAALKCGTYKGVVKGIEAGEFPNLPQFDTSGGIPIEAATFKEMIRAVAFAASVDESRPVLTGVLLQMDGKTIAMAATDGFRLALHKIEATVPLEKKQLIIPASVLKEVLRILSATKASTITLYLPSTGSQVVLRLDDSHRVQIVSQLIDGKFPDFQVIIPKGYKTRTNMDAGELLKACKQAGIIAREGSNVVRFHLQPGADQSGKVKLLAASAETGESEIELDATVEGQELEIAFNVKFLQDALEAISTKRVVIETNAHNTPATIRPAGEQGAYRYVLMPMHIDER